ncbi:MAG: hypothetical protein JRH15_01840 [Deltaproteobacteria bacterium]|nr:hypothetical protein [Deltaproteobacteria bacterium]
MIDSIKTPEFADQVKTDGVKSSFREGVIYRYPAMVPLLEVSGDHYEMGLQYGVLLRPEILRALESIQSIFKWKAEEPAMPVADFSSMFTANAEQIAERLPERFQQELQGMADGSGVPFATVITASLMYDSSEAAACSGVLMKGKDGRIIHGRNNDTSSYGGEETGKMIVIVRHRAKGYNVVTHMDYPLWGGVETGYNNQGLTFSEETLSVRNPNPDGFSLIYLIRMALEECTTFEDLYTLFDRYPVIGAYGCVWGQRKQGRGMVAELTPTAWKATEMASSLKWNFNHLYDAELRKQQSPLPNIAGNNWDREAIAETFPQKTEYKVEDAIEFLRLQKGPDNIDYSCHGLRHPICNLGTQEMVVFDPEEDGLYLAWGTCYASRNDVYRIHEDFSHPPERFLAADPVDPLVEQIALILNRLVTSKLKLDALVALSKEHNQAAYIHFLAAFFAFQQSRFDLLIHHANKAFSLEPEIAEHQLYAGMAASLEKNFDAVISLLEAIDSKQLYPNHELYRLSILESVWVKTDPGVSSKYADAKASILKEHDAKQHFKTAMLQLLAAMDNDKNDNDTAGRK